MPRLEDRTVADQVCEYLAPEQPDDCRQANLGLLAAALGASGPVVHGGQVVSLGKDGSITFDADRPRQRIPASTTEDADGNVTEIPSRDPNDADLAEQWGLPLAADIPLAPAS